VLLPVNDAFIRGSRRARYTGDDPHDKGLEVAQMRGGRHWNLLCFERVQEGGDWEAFYIDSMDGHNRKPTEAVARRFWKVLRVIQELGTVGAEAGEAGEGGGRVPPKAPVLATLYTPQQENADDCGVMVVMQAECLAKQHYQGGELDVSGCTQEHCRAKRKGLRAMVAGFQ
jgi:hypothetical protein